MLEIFSSGEDRSFLSKRNVLPSAKKPAPLKHLKLGVAASKLTVTAGCGGDSSSEVISAAPGTTGPVSNTRPCPCGSHHVAACPECTHAGCPGPTCCIRGQTSGNLVSGAGQVAAGTRRCSESTAGQRRQEHCTRARWQRGGHFVCWPCRTRARHDLHTHRKWSVPGGAVSSRWWLGHR